MLNIPTPTMLRQRAVADRTGLSRSTIYEMMARGEFPKPVKIGLRAVAWPEAEVVAFIRSRIEARDAA